MEPKYFVKFNEKGLSTSVLFTTDLLDSDWKEIPVKFINEDNTLKITNFKLENDEVLQSDIDPVIESLKQFKIQELKLNRDLELLKPIEVNINKIKYIFSTSVEAAQCYQYGLGNDGIQGFLVIKDGVKTSVDLTKEHCNLILKTAYEIKNAIHKKYVADCMEVNMLSTIDSINAYKNS